MSDFDKEAEREKLRKKYARDAEKRAHTQRMSDLLLQGATMTNQHCDRCGDPLFRHNGQTFCATCRAEDEAAAQAAGGDVAGDGRDSPAEHAEGDAVAGATGDADVRTNADRTADTVAVEPASSAEQSASHPDDRSVSSSPSDPSSPSSPSDPSSPLPSDHPSPSPSDPPSASSEPTASARTVDGDVTDRTAARRSLEATLSRFAAKAADTDDPRRAREFLAAAREAAEALAALE